MKLANLSGKTIAIMVASGFDETGFIAIQRVMMQAGAKLRIISREAGLTNAWNGSGWGMSYPADSTLSTALAIDYDGLIVPAGKRHIDTLQNEAHANLNKPAPEASRDHQNMSPEATPGCQGRGDHCVASARIGQHEYHHQPHDRRQQQVESFDRQAHTDQCTRYRPWYCAQRERQNHA